ncbi:TlpA family protein disulfide reductase [Niastella populi]|uniref:Thioredoxin domain-containing protein n=1 Tax=Niastella populi TaxID=550983 RepID=A0A1V9F7X8_9BACT|nr:TlpA disulfide reductase family protein [Niastella populi]OQP54415.1 hypothetical protein A4R26_28055 [Niastella populi]
MYRFLKNVLILIVLIVCTFLNVKAQKNKVIISGKFIGNNNSADSLTLCYWDNVISNQKKDFTIKRQYSSKVVNHSFSFEIDSIYDLSYITIGRNKFRGVPIPLLDLMIVSPGDNVHVEIGAAEINEQEKQWLTDDNGEKLCTNCDMFRFSGKSAATYSVQYQLWEETKRLQAIWDTTSIANSRVRDLVEQSRRLYSNMNYVLTGGLKYLEILRHSVSSSVFGLLTADLQGRIQELYFRGMNYHLKFTKRMGAANEVYLFRDEYNSIRDNFKVIERPEVQAKSNILPSTILFKLALESTLFEENDIYSLIKDKYSGILQERLLTSYLLNNTNLPKIDSLLGEAVLLVNDKRYKEVLSSTLENQKIGSGFFNYPLLDTSGKVFQLSCLKGKIIFIDFWFTGCGGCMQYYKQHVSKAENKFENNEDVVFVTISIDGNKDKWLQGLRSGEYTSAKAINLYTNGQGVAHPIIKRLNIIAYPFSIILDREGKLLISDSEKLRKGGVEKLILTINEAISKR